MVDSAGGLGFPDGCIIVVDPTVTAMPGDHVIVRLKTADEAIFRKLECDGDLRFLKPLNPAYPNMPLSSDAKIAGVVVQVNIETWARRAA
jgi:SOS-response transcriptional repressor LexA